MLRTTAQSTSDTGTSRDAAALARLRDEVGLPSTVDLAGEVARAGVAVPARATVVTRISAVSSVVATAGSAERSTPVTDRVHIGVNRPVTTPNRCVEAGSSSRRPPENRRLPGTVNNGRKPST